jgi:hypothetical protein
MAICNRQLNVNRIVIILIDFLYYNFIMTIGNRGVESVAQSVNCAANMAVGYSKSSLASVDTLYGFLKVINETLVYKC